ncbi:hypothetical protein [Phormidesmis priestleyi]|uniref:hypothetical protein n=1 Tax=Phormidesmis priestleyi TaxID=268141 RepID=UPI000932595B|nr:hypothetical protein [Phormidesmis priestleyi]
MIPAILNQSELSFEMFVDRYLENDRYELIDGELIDLEPTGLHEQVTGFVIMIHQLVNGEY